MKSAITQRKNFNKELSAGRRNKLYLVMMSLLLVGTIIWVLLMIMKVEDTTEATTRANQLAVPLNPNLDKDVFSTVESKRLLTEEELESFPINRLLKDRSGNYVVIPFDTPKDEIERLSSSTQTAPRATPVPTQSTAAGTATTNSTTNP